MMMRAILAKAKTTGIGAEETDAIYDHTRHITRFKISIWKSLLYFERFCGKDREVRLMNRTNDLFQK